MHDRCAMSTMTFILSCMALMLLALVANAAEQSVVPSFQWGESQQVALLGRAKPLHTGPGGVAYQERLGNLPALVSFRFVADQLSEVRYRFVAKRSRAAEFISDFAAIEALLLSQYGAPLTRNAQWDPNQPNEAVVAAIAAGELSPLTEWHTPSGILMHSLYGDDGKINHSLVVQPPNVPAETVEPSESVPLEPTPAEPESKAITEPVVARDAL